MKLGLIRSTAQAVEFGSRAAQNTKRLPGTSWQSLKKHYYLMPLFASMAFAVSLVIGFSTRMALKGSDVSWKKEQRPYDYYAERQYKFLNIANREFKQDPKMKEAQRALKED